MCVLWRKEQGKKAAEPLAKWVVYKQNALLSIRTSTIKLIGAAAKQKSPRIVYRSKLFPELLTPNVFVQFDQRTGKRCWSLSLPWVFRVDVSSESISRIVRLCDMILENFVRSFFIWRHVCNTEPWRPEHDEITHKCWSMPTKNWLHWCTGLHQIDWLCAQCNRPWTCKTWCFWWPLALRRSYAIQQFHNNRLNRGKAGGFLITDSRFAYDPMKSRHNVIFHHHRRR